MRYTLNTYKVLLFHKILKSVFRTNFNQKVWNSVRKYIISLNAMTALKKKRFLHFLFLSEPSVTIKWTFLKTIHINRWDCRELWITNFLRHWDKTVYFMGCKDAIVYNYRKREYSFNGRRLKSINAIQVFNKSIY